MNNSSDSSSGGGGGSEARRPPSKRRSVIIPQVLPDFSDDSSSADEPASSLGASPPSVEQQGRAPALGALQRYASSTEQIVGSSAALAERRIKSHKLRRTKIICTIGPASSSLEKVRSLSNAGMDVARMNFSHGSYAYHKCVSDVIDELNREHFERARKRWEEENARGARGDDGADSGGSVSVVADKIKHMMSRGGGSGGGGGTPKAVRDADASDTKARAREKQSVSDHVEECRAKGGDNGHEDREVGQEAGSGKPGRRPDMRGALYVKIAKLFDTKGAEVRSGEITRASELAEAMAAARLVTEDEKRSLIENSQVMAVDDGRVVFRCLADAFMKQPPPDRQAVDAAANADSVPVVPVIGVSFPGFYDDVDAGDTLLMDGGLLEFLIERKRAATRDLVCRVIDGGAISARRHLNVRGKTASLPSVTDTDWKDLEFGVVQCNIDYVALSFVNDADTVRGVRAFLDKLGSHARIIAKIESVKGVQNLDEIIAASDGIMVARGDLGAELPLEEVPIVQSFMVRQCRDAGKIVITATEMLESMIEKPIPTRAEASDVAHAVEQGADALMLSGETAKGQYPVRACATMRHIISRQNQQLIADERAAFGLDPEDTGDSCVRDSERVSAEMARAAVQLAQSLDAAAIVVFTRTGTMPKRLSKLRCRVPILAATGVSDTMAKLALLWNVFCVSVEIEDTFEETFGRFVKQIKAEGYLREGDTIVVVQSGTHGIWRAEAQHLLRYVTL